MAIYPDDAIPNYTVPGFSSMANRRPDNEFSIDKKFEVEIWNSNAGYEKRRLKNRRPKREIELKYSNITGLHLQAIENFYNSRYGEFESFTFDQSHIGLSGYIRARFKGSLEIKQVLSNSNILLCFYDVEFKLMETFD